MLLAQRILFSFELCERKVGKTGKEDGLALFQDIVSVFAWNH
jgi:hypothetical protein